MSPWEQFRINKLKILSQKSILLDIGDGKPFQKDMQPFRSLFKKTQYFTLDMNYKFKPHLTANALSLPIKTSSVDAIICKAVLEHVVNPLLVIDEMYRVCKKNGTILIYAPFIYPFHGDKDFGDYYRYTRDGLNYMFRHWNNVEIEPVRGYLETLLILLPRKIYTVFYPLARVIDQFFNTPQTSGYWLFATK